MYQYLFENNGLAFVNLDDQIQVEKTKALTVFSFGQGKISDVVIRDMKANPFVEIAYNDVVVASHLIGLYNANNLNATIAIGKYFKVDDLAIKEALEGYVPENNRSQLISKGSNEIILDAYNANPSSMAVAIQNFVQLNKANKVMVLGDMFELGDDSLKEHKAIVEMSIIDDAVICFFIGKAFYESRKDKSNFKFYESFSDFETYLKETPFFESMILIKGSRGMALERTLEFL